MDTLTPRCAGLVQVGEGFRLRRLAASIPADEAIVEIGSHTGLSTCWLAGQASAHVTAIDPWGDPRPGSEDDPFGLGRGDAVLEAFLANVEAERYGSRITALRTTSVEAARIWTKSIGLLFVDAVHEYDAVRDDIVAWLPFLGRGAWIAFHDWTDDPEHPYAGVKRAIDDHLGPGWQPAAVVGNLWSARRD